MEAACRQGYFHTGSVDGVDALEQADSGVLNCAGKLDDIAVDPPASLGLETEAFAKSKVFVAGNVVTEEAGMAAAGSS